MTRRDAAALAERALAAVFPPELVARLREDSPLAALGLQSADLVALADAVADAAGASGTRCALSDEDLDGLVTVADLVTAIELRTTEGATGVPAP